MQEFGRDVALNFRSPRTLDDALWVKVAPCRWKGQVYFDPVTATERGRRGEDEGAVNLMVVHEPLFLGDLGKNILAATALAYGLMLLVVGLYLWWPKNWKHAWTIKWPAIYRDWHVYGLETAWSELEPINWAHGSRATKG